MKHKKVIFSLLLLVLGLTGLQAQEALSTSGGNASGSGGTVAYSVGQVVYTTNSGTNGWVAQGVQQQFEFSVVSVIADGEVINLTYSAYPNPTNDFLVLEIKGNLQTHFIASLYDLSGKLLQKKKITENETSIDMNNLLPAIYFLKVIQGSKEVKTFKITKN
jgi:hypothetical protein